MEVTFVRYIKDLGALSPDERNSIRSGIQTQWRSRSSGVVWSDRIWWGYIRQLEL